MLSVQTDDGMSSGNFDECSSAPVQGLSVHSSLSILTIDVEGKVYRVTGLSFAQQSDSVPSVANVVGSLAVGSAF